MLIGISLDLVDKKRETSKLLHNNCNAINDLNGTGTQSYLCNKTFAPNSNTWKSEKDGSEQNVERNAVISALIWLKNANTSETVKLHAETKKTFTEPVRGPLSPGKFQ